MSIEDFSTTICTKESMQLDEKIIGWLKNLPPGITVTFHLNLEKKLEQTHYAGKFVRDLYRAGLTKIEINGDIYDPKHNEGHWEEEDEPLLELEAGAAIHPSEISYVSIERP